MVGHPCLAGERPGATGQAASASSEGPGGRGQAVPFDPMAYRARVLLHETTLEPEVRIFNGQHPWDTTARGASDASNSSQVTASDGKANQGKSSDEWKARMRQLGVVEAQLAEVEAEGSLLAATLSPTTGSTIRVMQWNLLADGLADDAFMVHDVLGAHGSEVPFKRPAAGGLNAAMEEQAKQPERAARCLKATVDWEARFARIRAVIEQLQPDVITVQELDHMAEAEVKLRILGYSCTLGAASYVPAHAAAINQGPGARGQGLAADAAAVDATRAGRYIEHLTKTQVAFAPKLPSKCRELAQQAGLANADDDGVAIFWRADRLTASALEFRLLTTEVGAKRQQGAVRVHLKRPSDGAQLYVITAHLASGDKSDDEAERLLQIHGPTLHESGTSLSRGGLRAWLRESATDGIATLLCLDANSSPGRAEERTVWKALRGMSGVQSVWDEHFTPSGALQPTTLPGRSSPFPVTTNKLRGPLSKQKAKVGEHAIHTIDHIFFLGDGLQSARHAWGPITFADKAQAHGKLLPSLHCPSDHLPVVVDIELRGRIDSTARPRTPSPPPPPRPPPRPPPPPPTDTPPRGGVKTGTKRFF